MSQLTQMEISHGGARGTPKPPPGRWWIAVMGAMLQMCLGSVYAWSYFQQPLVDLCGWRHAQVAWTFSLAICFLGLAAAIGGVLLPRFGPRKLALAGGSLYALGFLLAAFAVWRQSLPLLWLGYGVIGGFGLGLGYVTPVATVARWFPDRKGLVTGMVVMGFGFGAFVMSKIFAPMAGSLFDNQLPLVFAGAGVCYGAVSLFAASFLKNPPDPENEPDQGAATDAEHGARANLVSARFIGIWVVFFCNITAGIALIGFQSPLLQGLLKAHGPARSPAALAAAGATLIAASSICNGLGRLFWGGLSDRIGALSAFRLILGSQVIAFCFLMVVRNPWLFGGLVCYVLLCYGGGFGVMPAFISNTFGARLMPVMYGAILTAWSCAGIAGPQLIARLKDRPGANVPLCAFGLCASLLAVGLALLVCRIKSQQLAQKG
jgi:OFA family oxalate/formate antiporter-like MFS transporter